MNNDFFEKLDENYDNRQEKEQERKKKNRTYNRNGISSSYKAIGYICIILCIIIGISSENIILYFFIGIGSGLANFAIAEIIQLLQDIKDRLSYKNDDTNE